MNLQSSILEQVNYRISQEEISSRLYYAISIFLNYKGYSGAAKLFEKYSNEELVHAQWSYDYLLSLNILPDVRPITTPTQGSEFKDLSNIIELTLKHENEITIQCNKFAKMCSDSGDLITFSLAQKYCKEQIEEMDKANYWVDRLNLFGNSPVAMRMQGRIYKEAAIFIFISKISLIILNCKK